MRYVTNLLILGIMIFLNPLLSGQKTSTVQPKGNVPKMVRPASQPKPAVTKKPERNHTSSVSANPHRTYYHTQKPLVTSNPTPVGPVNTGIPDVPEDRVMNNNLYDLDYSMSSRKWRRFSDWNFRNMPSALYPHGVIQDAAVETGEVVFVNETGLPLEIYLKGIGDKDSKSAMSLDYSWVAKRTKPDYVLNPGEVVAVKVAIDKGISYSAQTSPGSMTDRIFRSDGKVFFSDEDRRVVFN